MLQFVFMKIVIVSRFIILQIFEFIIIMFIFKGRIVYVL